MKNKTGQMALETSLLIVILVAALIAMQFYMKRGASGYLRRAIDQISTGRYDTRGGTVTKTFRKAKSLIQTRLKNFVYWNPEYPNDGYNEYIIESVSITQPKRGGIEEMEMVDEKRTFNE